MKLRLVALTASCSLLLVGCTPRSTGSQIPTSNLDKSAQIAQIPPEALKNALNLFTKAKENGVDLSNGPCLGKVADDWVADIVHNPRQPIDDKPENQCEDYRKGNAHHFIELDQSGSLVAAH